MFEYKKHSYDDKIESKNINNYEKIERIGKGGFGKVYLCKDKKKSEKVVIKKVRKDKYAYIEVMILKILNKNKDKLKYSTIIEYIDSFKHNDTVFIVMKRINGLTYNEYIKSNYHPKIYNGNNFSSNDIYRLMYIFKNINGILKDIHSLGILHLDVKGSNIMLKIKSDDNHSDHSGHSGHSNHSNNPEDIKVYLIDYGLSRLKYDKHDTIYGINSIHGVLGTHCYIAPEILNKTYDKIDIHSDIYSFGMILYFTFFRTKFDDINSLNERGLKEHKVKNLYYNDYIEDINDKYPTNDKVLNNLIIKLISGMLYVNIHKRFNYDDIKKNIKDIIKHIS